jgi:hypothetical protein
MTSVEDARIIFKWKKSSLNDLSRSDFLFYFFLISNQKIGKFWENVFFSIENSTIFANLLGIFDTHMPLVYL